MRVLLDENIPIQLKTILGKIAAKSVNDPEIGLSAPFKRPQNNARQREQIDNIVRCSHYVLMRPAWKSDLSLSRTAFSKRFPEDRLGLLSRSETLAGRICLFSVSR